MRVRTEWLVRAAMVWAMLCAATLPLAAANIDVSGNTTVTVNTGECLFFTVSDGNFVQNAQSLGVSPYPNAVMFQLLTAPLADPGQFDVSLESADGSVSTAIPGALSFAPGTLHGSLYSGPISALSGTLYLSPGLSQSLFAGSPAILVVRNLGAPVVLGLAPYTMRQDMFISLRGDSFSVGAVQGAVVLDPPDPSDPVPTPEPGTVLLVAAGGGVLAVAWARRKRHGGTGTKSY